MTSATARESNRDGSANLGNHADARSARWRGGAAVLGVVVAFSLSSTLVKRANTPGVLVAFWRLTTVSVVWNLYLRCTGRRVTMRHVRQALIPGVFFGLNLAIFFAGATHNSVANAALIGSLSPFLIVPLGAWLFSEHFDLRALVFALVAFVGVGVVLFSAPTNGDATARGNMYGPTSAPLGETNPMRPTSAKSRTRATMSAELLAAHQRGEVRVAIGRASDFIGRGVRDSAFGEFVFQPALAGKRAQTIGRPDTLHTYSYVPDIGRNLVLLGSRDEAFGRAWHLPNPDTRTTRQIILEVYAAAGSRRTSVTALNMPMLRAIGLFNRNVRELTHTYYQFAQPFVVDDSVFRAAFGGHTTSWDEIVTRTIDWYRAQTTTPNPQDRLAPAPTLKVTSCPARRTPG